MDVLNQENQNSYNQIDVGFAVELELKEVIGKQLVSERQVLDFKMECRGMLQTIVSRIHKKSPLTYTLVRNLNSLDPCEIIKNDEDKSCERFKRVLNVLHACNKVDIGKCDIILEEYRVFLRSARHSKHFKLFDKENQSLDELYFSEMNNCIEVSNVWPVMKILLLLSHGQASVERSFSVNKEVSEQNMSEQTLVARRMIKDHICSVGGLTNVIVTQDLLNSAQGSRQKYMLHLELKRSESEKKEKGEKRKAVEMEAEVIRKKN